MKISDGPCSGKRAHPPTAPVPVRSPRGAVRYQVGNVHFHCNALVATSARFRRPTWCHRNK